MCKLCWTLLILLLLALGGAAYKWVVLGSVEAAPDGRQAIRVTEEERNLVLGEMRDFLVAVQAIVDAVNRAALDEAAAAATKVGMAAQQGVPPQLMGKLPLAFKKLGFDTHRKFDELALDARQLGDPSHTLSQLGRLLTNCTACHASYSLVAAGP